MGEHPKGREAMDGMIRKMREAGAPTEYAERKAREAAIRHDRKEGR